MDELNDCWHRSRQDNEIGWLDWSREEASAGLLGLAVSPAFAEDPLRVLRVARFAARFGFDVAPETEALLRGIVASGELTLLGEKPHSPYYGTADATPPWYATGARSPSVARAKNGAP